MKKLLLLIAAGLIFQVTPVFADDHKGGEGRHGGKGEMFEKHDTNGDGSISQAEFLEHAKVKFTKIDTNGDASISKEEAKAGHKARRHEMKDKRKEKRSSAGAE